MGCCGGRVKRGQPYIPGGGYTAYRWEKNGPIKVLGGITGKTYKFEGYGSVVPIDNRDVGNVKSIPGMRLVE